MLELFWLSNPEEKKCKKILKNAAILYRKQYASARFLEGGFASRVWQETGLGLCVSPHSTTHNTPSFLSILRS